MSTEPEPLAQHDFEIDITAPPMMVGAQVADAVLPLVTKVACDGMTHTERLLFWHGLMAAITSAMGAQVGLVQSEAIMSACIGYGRRMAAEEAEAAKGAH